MIVWLQAVLVMADTFDKTDVCSASLISKDDEPITESLSDMDVIEQTQAQSMDTSCSSGDAKELKADVNCGPADEEMACNQPVGAESAMSCQSVPSSNDMDVKSDAEECTQIMETGSQENAIGCDMLDEKEIYSVKEKENEETTTVHQSVDDEGKSSVCERAEETETLPAVVQPTADEAVLNDDSLVATSPEATPPSGKHIKPSAHVQ